MAKYHFWLRSLFKISVFYSEATLSAAKGSDLVGLLFSSPPQSSAFSLEIAASHNEREIPNRL